MDPKLLESLELAQASPEHQAYTAIARSPKKSAAQLLAVKFLALA